MAVIDVEVFECERYRVMGGWSKDYLMPTESSAYRMRNCKKSWKNLAEVDDALLGPGWTWERVAGGDGWQLSPLPSTDADGWSYGVGFSSSFEGAPKGGVHCFARWRRMIRSQAFAGDTALLQAVSGPAANGCKQVDLDAVGELSQRLLDTLAAGSVYQGEAPLHKVTKLKWGLAESLFGNKCAANLDAALKSFIDAQRSRTTRVQEAFGGSAVDNAVAAARREQIDAEFIAEERESFATLAIRKYQPEISCSDTSGGEHNCRYRPVLCSYAGCGSQVSSHALQSHQEHCRFMPLPCEKCGEAIPRGEHRMHSSVACPLREAKCTFACIGCDVPLVQQALVKHLDDCQQSHVLMLLCALQDVIKTLTARVAQLESRSESFQTYTGQVVEGLGNRTQALEQESKALPATIDGKVAAVSKLAAEERKKSYTAAVEEARKNSEKMSRKVEEKVGTVQTEVAGIQSQLKNMQALGAAAARTSSGR